MCFRSVENLKSYFLDKVDKKNIFQRNQGYVIQLMRAFDFWNNGQVFGALILVLTAL